MSAHDSVEPRRLWYGLPNCHCFKTVADILKTLRESIGLRFTPAGITIVEYGARETSVQKYEFFGRQMLCYNYPFDASEKPSYTIGVSAADLFAALKSDAKKEPFKTCTIINPATGQNGGLLITRAGTTTSLEGVNMVSTHTQLPPMAEPMDHYKLIFANEDPNSKVFTGPFMKAFNTIKSRECNIVSFELISSGTVLMKGKRDSGVVTVYALPSDAFEIVERSVDAKESNEGDDLRRAMANMGMELQEDENYSIDLNIKNVLWFLKLNRLAPENFIEIYMAPGAPLIMRIALSNYGMVTYSFNSDPTPSSW